MADAVDSKSTIRKGVRVRLPPRARSGRPRSDAARVPGGICRCDGVALVDRTSAESPAPGDAPPSSPTPGTGAFEPRSGLVRDVVDEIRWTFTKRLGWIAQIALNLAIGVPAVIVTTWNHHTDDVRVSGFATSLAGWVLASALNGNQLGFDADRAAASFRAGDTAWRVLFLKNLSILVVLAPPILLASVVLRLTVAHAPDPIPVALVRDLAVITVWLGFGSILSVLLPFRPLGLRGRWARPSTWARWSVCLAAPYVVYYLLAHFWHLPELAVADLILPHGDRRHLWDYSLWMLLWGLLTWGLGLALSEAYYRIRPTGLEDDLDRER